MKYSNSILDALERINEKLGGRKDDAGTIIESLDQIADNIEENGGGKVIVDPTLTKEHQAADAKAAGDRLTDIRAAVGSPLKASTASGMTDTDKVYVYTGSESGYTSGNWYYYDSANEAWTSGGVYNAVAVETDTTLTVSGGVADAKATGDEISELKATIDDTTEIAGKNLFNPRQLLSVSGITLVDGAYSATAGNYAAAFPSSSNGLTIYGGFKSNQRYTLSLQIKNTGSTTATGWGIAFYILYTDGTTRNTSISRDVTSFALRTLISEANKTIGKIYIAAPSSPENTWEIKDIQIEEGSSATAYEAYSLLAVDDTARQSIEEINETLDDNLYYEPDLPSPQSGYIRYSDGATQGSSSAAYYILKNTGYDRIAFKGYATSNTVAAIAFYSTDSITTDGYLKPDSKNYTTLSQQYWIEATVPSSAKIIVVCGGKDVTGYIPAVKFRVKEIYKLFKAEEEKQINRVAYFMPFPNEKLIDHLFVGQVTSSLTQNIIIPCQSVFHVALSARLGYKYIECNVQKTATEGKYIVTHGSSGKFGKDFQTINGESAEGVVIGNISYNDLRNGYKYISQIPAYEVPPTSLEEFLYACKENKIVPMVMYRDNTMLEIAKGIVGNEMILYNGDHSVFDGIVHTFHSFTTKEEIIAQCEKIGAPYLYGMGNPGAFTNSELVDIIDTIHKMGCLIGISSAYGLSQKQRCTELGIDFDGTDSQVNPFETGDIATLNSFDEFELSASASINNGVLTIPEGSNVSSGAHSGGLIKWCCKIMFNGTLKIDNKTFTSDGTHMVYVSGFKINEPHTLWIIAEANTVVTMLKYVVAKC